MKTYTVYKHTTPDGKSYIGMTSTSVKQRWNNGKGYKNHTYFYKAIKKYGWDNIEHSVLFEGLTKDKACEKEKEMIKKYRSNEPEYGYNMTDGGIHYTLNEQGKMNLSEIQKGRVVSEETKIKISKSEKGKYVSKESREKMSIAQRKRKVSQSTIDNLRKMANDRKGKPLSEETKRKISEKLKGHPSTTLKGKDHPNYGKHLPVETRMKISKSHKENISDEFRENVSKRFSKQVRCVETGEIFPSIKVAAEKYNISPSQLGAVCSDNPRYKTAKKLHWEFV